MSETTAFSVCTFSLNVELAEVGDVELLLLVLFERWQLAIIPNRDFIGFLVVLSDAEKLILSPNDFRLECSCCNTQAKERIWWLKFRCLNWDLNLVEGRGIEVQGRVSLRKCHCRLWAVILGLGNVVGGGVSCFAF